MLNSNPSLSFRKIFIFLLIFLIPFTPVQSHEGHNPLKTETSASESDIAAPPGSPSSWMQWFGSFHLLILHFPIALIITAFLFEWLFIWRKNPQVDSAQQLMLLTAAFSCIPATILGLLYRYSSEYSGRDAEYILWHMWLGIITTILAFFVVYIQRHGGRSPSYYISFCILFLLVTVTGYLGGIVSFGLDILSLPAH